MLKGIYAVIVDGIDEATADMLQARLNRWAGREQFCVLPVPKDTMVYFDRIEEQEVADTAARHPVYNVYGTINYPDSMERAVEP